MPAIRKARRRQTEPYFDGMNCADPAEPSPSKRPISLGPGSLKQSVDGRRILVIDDEKSARKGYALLLTFEGYEVVAVATAEEALQQLERDSFDLVLSDVNLPGIDGYTFTSLVREDGRTVNTPIILISAVGGTRRKVTGFESGADDFMEKPVHPEELVARIGAHIRRAARSQELEQLSTHDALTGLLNRRALEDELLRELRRMTRTHLPVSLIMVDLVAFKAINDQHGHLAGDEALRRVAVKLESSLRATDRVGRYGGDEFLIILPDTNAHQLEDLIGRLRLAWRRHPPMVPRAPRPVMASFGGATAAPGDNIESLIRMADAAMYRDKRGTAER